MFDFPVSIVHYVESIATIIKIPTDKEPNSYQGLVCTEQDKTTIYEIITTLAEHGKLSLLLKQSHLKGLGSQINHVHPLKFLSTIVTNPRLRECLVDIFDDYFKRNGFMDGIGPSLSREAERGKLAMYVNDFSEEVKVKKEDVEPFFRKQDWEGLVRFFFN